MHCGLFSSEERDRFRKLGIAESTMDTELNGTGPSVG